MLAFKALRRKKIKIAPIGGKRKAYVGKLIQVDAAPFEWFGNGQKFSPHRRAYLKSGIFKSY
ncbi:hypothetical protein K420107F6_08170 [Lactonifactor longoviformis]